MSVRIRRPELPTEEPSGRGNGGGRRLGLGKSRMRRSGEKKRIQPAAQIPMKDTHSAGRTPISVPSSPPRIPPIGIVPQTTPTQNRIWLEIVQLALDLLASMPMLALTGETRRWEPKRLRLRLFSAAGQLVTTGRRRWLCLARRWPWTQIITAAFGRLQTLPNPG